MKLNKRGIIIIVALVVLAIVGIGGYGVYSYYYTEGEFKENSWYDEENDIFYGPDLVFNKRFDPRIDGSFIYDNVGISIECGDVESDGYITCTGSKTIFNNGSDPIDVEISDTQYCVEYVGCYAIDDSNFNWTQTSVNAGQSKILNLTLRVPIISEEEEEGTTSGNNIYIDASFTVAAANHVE